MDRAKRRAMICAGIFWIFGALIPGFICGNVSIVILGDNLGSFIILLTVGMILPIALHLYFLYKNKARMTFIFGSLIAVGLSSLILYSISKRLLDVAGFVYFFIIIPYIGIVLVLITVYRLIKLRSTVARPRSTVLSGLYYCIALVLSCALLVLGHWVYPRIADINKTHEIVRMNAMVIGFVAPLIVYFWIRAYSKSLYGYIFIALAANAAMLAICVALRSVFDGNMWVRPGFYQYAQYCICFILLTACDLAVSYLKRQDAENTDLVTDETK